MATSLVTYKQIAVMFATVVVLQVLAITSSSSLVHGQQLEFETYPQQQFAMSQQQQQDYRKQPPVKLPNINFFVNPNENYKLLGLNATIPYITAGVINDYALNFVIPLGYNQSDMIFNWQNLGSTNVNYSISLVITNIQAVDAPLINITRTGLIPRHEQVFKITLPCSGKESAEADVQVLVNIAEQLPPQSIEQPAVGNSSKSSDEVVVDERKRGAASATQQQPTVHMVAIRRRKICARDPVIVSGPVHSPLPMQKSRPIVNPANSAIEASNAETNSSLNGRQQQINNDKTKIQYDGLNNDDENDPDVRRSQLDVNWTAHDNQPENSVNKQVVASLDRMLNELSIKAQPNVAPNFFAGNSISPMRAPNFSPPSLAPPQRQHLPMTFAAILIVILVALIILALLSSALSSPSSSSSSSSNYGVEHYKSPFDRLGTLSTILFNRAPKIQKCKPPTMSGAVISTFRANPKVAASTLSALSLQNNNFTNTVCKGGHHHRHTHHPSNMLANNTSNAATKPSSYFYKAPHNQTSNEHYYPPSSTTNNAYKPAAGSYQSVNYAQPPTGDLLGPNYFASSYFQSMPHNQQQQYFHLNQQQSQQNKQTPNNSVASSSASGNSGNYPINHHNPAITNASQTTRLVWTNGNGTTTQDGYTVDASYIPMSHQSARSDSGSVYQTIY